MPCPRCGTPVRLKTTIPVLVDGTVGHACVACARRFLDVAAPEGGTGGREQGRP